MRRRFSVAFLLAVAAFTFTSCAMSGGSGHAVGSARALGPALVPFPRGSIWRAPIPAGAQLDPQSADKLANWLAGTVKNPNMTLREDAVAVAVARASDPHYRIRCSSGWKCTLGAFGSIPIPQGTKPDPSDDGHLAIYDPATHHEWDLWRASCCWQAVAGSAIATRRQSVAPRGTASADAANFPLLGGLIRPEEIARGLIAHPIVFGQPGIGPGAPVCPATSNAQTSSNPLALQEGTHLQLDPTLNVRKLGLPRWQRVVARALQVYGMYLRDNSGTLAIYAENTVNRASDPWAALGLRGGSASFSSHFPWSRMRILKAPRLSRGACPRPHTPGR